MLAGCAARAPLTCLLCFLLPDPTHASGSLLILQGVSDRLAARLCGVCYVPSLLRRVLMAGYAGMCPTDLPALFSFALPHTCIWIPPISAARE